MKKNIAVIGGGDSSEVEISLRSAAGVYSFIDKEKYNPFIVTMINGIWQVKISEKELIDIDKNDFSFMQNSNKIKFDFAYITIHGTPGEDGKLQGYFDMLNMPYSCCGVLASSLTFDKFMCNNYLKYFGIKAADSVMLKQGQTITNKEVIDKIGLPCFIKPSVGGSSFGVTKVKTEDQILPAISKAFAEGEKIMIESFIDGTEITCGIYKTKDKTIVFPITEVVSENEFFDYEAKYEGKVKEITPARLSDALTDRVKMLTSAIYDILDCKGIIRVDYIISDGEIINLLEINTNPGMTNTSFIPQQVVAAQLDIKDVISDIIENEFLMNLSEVTISIK